MVFSSHLFVFYYLPLVLGTYYLTPGRLKNRHLTLASYVFYGWWNPWFVSLMLLSTVINYWGGLWIVRSARRPRARRLGLALSVASNLSLLGFFRYWSFFASNVDVLAPSVGVPRWDIVLPVGISFYTLQSMSYTIDLYHGRAERAHSFLDFAAFVSLFPKLVAGPIVRYRTIAEELRSREHSVERVAFGLARFAVGMAKKLMLADNAGAIADAVFAADRPPWHIAWMGVIAYAFQIYFDFSGYSDMAMGLGHTLGFTVPENFNAPYRAESITDFWRRWHISLSTWLRDYLYIPLGGNRQGVARTYVNLMITMVLGGLWHGAAWSFVVWGGIHGFALCLERLIGQRAIYGRLPRPLRVAVTFGIVLVTWVFFRAESLREALRFLGSMFAIVPATAASSLVAVQAYGSFPLIVLTSAAIVVLFFPTIQEWTGATMSWRRAAVTLVLFVTAICELALQAHRPFLYFQF
ncbi:MAG: MBOAT family protein [Acidobacteriota bacterium]